MTTAHGPDPLPESDFWFYGAVAKNWRWMTSLGGLALLLGVIGLLAALTLSLATGVLFALLLRHAGDAARLDGCPRRSASLGLRAVPVTLPAAPQAFSPTTRRISSCRP